MDLEYRLLGPLEVRTGHGRVRLASAKQRALLASLLLRTGEVVSFSELVEDVWGDAPPARPSAALQMQVSRLRRALGAAAGEDRDPAYGPSGARPPDSGVPVLVTTPAGYALRVDPERVDLRRFERLAEQGRRALAAGSHEEASTALRTALGLWQGPPLADVSAERLRQTVVPRLEEMRLAAVEDRIEAELRLGLHDALVSELRELVGRNPFRERLSGQLMLALYRAGRQAEALALYRQAHRAMSDELALEPGSELRRLEQAILNRDPALDLPATEPGRTRSRAADPGADGAEAGEAEAGGAAPEQVRVVPAQLPADVAQFSGRAEHLRELDGLLAAVTASAARDAPTAVVISAIAGTAGVGKTALAVHWAHRARRRFPDGQLYVNLRGFDPGRPPMTPEEAVRGLLDALDVPAPRIPADPDAQFGLYRSLLADRRMLVLLDNARDAEQVLPLLPASPGCLVVVTSRNQLAGLVASAGARPLNLGLPTAQECRELLAGRLDPARLAAEPAAVEDIISSCARLPLALAIVAARAATNPRFSLSALAAELRDAHGRLDALAGGDAASDVRAVFSWSYRTLSEPAARLFRLLGVHSGPDVSAAAAASLAGLPGAAVRRALAELTRAHLLTEQVPGRYSFHDLLRAYSAELAGDTDAEQDRRAAVHRALDHYLHTVHEASRPVDPYRDPIHVGPARPGVSPESFADLGQALAWFAAERAVLLAAIEQAAEYGFDTHAWQLPWAINVLLDGRDRSFNAHSIYHTGLAAAQRARDEHGQSRMHRLLARTCSRQGRPNDAVRHVQRALEMCVRIGDRIGQARCHGLLSEIADGQGRKRESLAQSMRSLEVLQDAGHLAGQARVLNNIGWDLTELGEPAEALDHCERALELFRKIGDRMGEAMTWDTLGNAHRGLGRRAEAIDCFQRSLELCRELGDRYNETDILRSLGDLYAEAGSLDDARSAWRSALVILEDLEHPDAEQVRATLAGT